jgi:methylenetetrahydrofolate--tRNA-(uracil-5-)-methyltransferase
LIAARRATAMEFEHAELFRACQPVEEVARTGRDSLRFGAMKPVGLTDPASGLRPWAVVQLRSENQQGSAYNLVGFQTNLAFGEQERVFRMIPGLGDAEFLRHGVMHRNTFVDAPRVLDPTFALLDQCQVRFAGQVTGTEGYCEAAASGLFAALNTYADIMSSPPVALPATTSLGALLAYATDPATGQYEPMHVNFGLLPPLAEPVRGKRERYAAYAERAQRDMAAWIAGRDDLFGPEVLDA